MKLQFIHSFVWYFTVQNCVYFSHISSYVSSFGLVLQTLLLRTLLLDMSFGTVSYKPRSLITISLGVYILSIYKYYILVSHKVVPVFTSMDSA